MKTQVLTALCPEQKEKMRASEELYKLRTRLNRMNEGIAEVSSDAVQIISAVMSPR